MKDWLGTPRGSCDSMTSTQRMVTRPDPGKPVGLPMRMPLPGSKGCACSLVPARAEKGHVENIDACNDQKERRRECMRVCRRRAVFQVPHLLHTSVHAASGLHARCPVLKKQVGVEVVLEIEAVYR